MTCIKTGFNGYIVPNKEYVHGDLYQTDDMYYLRISSRYDRRPDWLDRLHIVVADYTEWFDEYREDGPSTMITVRHMCNWCVYDEVPFVVEDRKKESTDDTTQAG